MAKDGTVAPRERINTKYAPTTEDRQAVAEPNVQSVIRDTDLSLQIAVPNRLETLLENSEERQQLLAELEMLDIANSDDA
ncbi:hypothetical protein [Aidingimonas lacisalsi]|uniref:hypothetical protein n=1 Tax=Aidingimonas lacisalsi TaxID=2604086 RepID=UPI0011D18067|nr:hypothetical protein [Aidingimonas lacisalsi]